MNRKSNTTECDKIVAALAKKYKLNLPKELFSQVVKTEVSDVYDGYDPLQHQHQQQQEDRNANHLVLIEELNEGDDGTEEYSDENMEILVDDCDYEEVDEEDEDNDNDTKDVKAETIDDVKKALTERLNTLERNMSVMMHELLREVRTLRAENNSLRIGIQCQAGREHRASQNQARGKMIPTHPFRLDNDFLRFDREIEESDEKHQKLVAEFININTKTPEKFVRTCWRRLISDQVAKNFSWRGTVVKGKVCDMAVTLAIRNAFRQKYVMDYDSFDKVCQKYFLYAHDRINKLRNYHESKC